MKEWSKDFYQSKAWQDCRESFLISRNFICERCGNIAKIVHHKAYITPKNISDPYITLAHDNLEALCQNCHNAEHRKAAPKAARYTFDATGDIVYPPQSERGPLCPQTETAQ